MAADLDAVASAFVKVLLENARAREAFYAAMHPPDNERAAVVINEYAGAAGPIEASDIPALLLLISALLSDTRDESGNPIASSIMPGDRGDSGGASASIMPGDRGEEDEETGGGE